MDNFNHIKCTTFLKSTMSVAISFFGFQSILNCWFYEGNKNDIKTQTLLRLLTVTEEYSEEIYSKYDFHNESPWNCKAFFPEWKWHFPLSWRLKKIGSIKSTISTDDFRENSFPKNDIGPMVVVIYFEQKYIETH